MEKEFGSSWQTISVNLTLALPLSSTKIKINFQNKYHNNTTQKINNKN